MKTPSPTLTVSVFGTKSYDRESLAGAPGADRLTWRWHAFRLSAETAPAASGAQAVCSFVNDQADRACLEILASLGVQLLAVRGAGYNHVDLTAARELGLDVIRVPAYSPHAVAEHAVALLLTLNRKIHRASNRVRDLNFSIKGLVGFNVHGKTVGIIGTGRIGRIAAQIFQGFGTEILVHDCLPDPQWAAKLGVHYVELDTLLAASDIISLHLPLLPETRHLLNAHSLAQMKPGVFLVNTSRGQLIDTAALIAALKSGHLGGVALDVYEREESIFFEDLSGQILQDDALSLLIHFPNVLITAHQGFLTHEALSEIARVTTTNLLRLKTGEPFLPDTLLTPH